ncbi:hypothetical protein J2Y70_003378 [Xanthomonas translucens]|nr:hypothetical protein [Xanthomonas translucens]
MASGHQPQPRHRSVPAGSTGPKADRLPVGGTSVPTRCTGNASGPTFAAAFAPFAKMLCGGASRQRLRRFQAIGPTALSTRHLQAASTHLWEGLQSRRALPQGTEPHRRARTLRKDAPADGASSHCFGGPGRRPQRVSIDQAFGRLDPPVGGTSVPTRSTAGTESHRRARTLRKDAPADGASSHCFGGPGRRPQRVSIDQAFGRLDPPVGGTSVPTRSTAGTESHRRARTLRKDAPADGASSHCFGGPGRRPQRFIDQAFGRLDPSVGGTSVPTRSTDRAPA